MNEKALSHPLSDQAAFRPCKKCSDRGDGICFFCELPIKEPPREEPKPFTCPDPLCILGMTEPQACLNCPKRPKPHPGWGGKRIGAGAPAFNLNRLTHGAQSKLLKRGITRMAADPELRVVLYIIARLADTGQVPAATKKLIQKMIAPRAVKKEVW